MSIFNKKSGRKAYFKKFEQIKDKDEKYQRIINYLNSVSSPVTGNKVSQDLNIPYEEVDLIIQCSFTQLTEDATHSGAADPDLWIIGDNIKKISENWYYNVMKSRLSIGYEAWRKTGGVLR